MIKSKIKSKCNRCLIKKCESQSSLLLTETVCLTTCSAHCYQLIGALYKIYTITSQHVCYTTFIASTFVHVLMTLSLDIYIQTRQIFFQNNSWQFYEQCRSNVYFDISPRRDRLMLCLWQGCSSAQCLVHKTFKQHIKIKTHVHQFLVMNHKQIVENLVCGELAMTLLD